MPLFKLKQVEVNAQKITAISPSFSGYDITLEDGSTYYAHSVPDNIWPGDYFIPMEGVVYNGYDCDFILMEERQFKSMFMTVTKNAEVQIRYQPAQYPIHSWWEDDFGVTIKPGRDGFRGVYQGNAVLVITPPCAGGLPIVLNEATLEIIPFDYKQPITIAVDSIVADAIFDSMKSKE